MTHTVHGQVGPPGRDARHVPHPVVRILDRFLLPAFGAMQLAEISPADVRDWYAQTLIDKPTMRAHSYALLKSILATAVTDELLDANPCRIRGAGQTAWVRKIRPATLQELEILTGAMPERLKLTVPLATWLALRFGEMIELRRYDVDLDASVWRAAAGWSRNGGVWSWPGLPIVQPDCVDELIRGSTSVH